MAVRVGNKVQVQVTQVEVGGAVRTRRDYLATEEPMEIRLRAGGQQRTVAVTMRTPGQDFELAAGFLFAEGVVTAREQIQQIRYCVEPDVEPEQRYNIVTVWLNTPQLPELATLERHFFTTSACGVCGKATLESLEMRGCPVLPPGPQVTPEDLCCLPQRMRQEQPLFDRTGGLHAAGLFDPQGRLLAVREDVGRHNAVDKLIGWALMQKRLPLHDSILMVSGRASYEILQKSIVAGLPMVCAVSAPSNLALALAQQFRVTLVGFLRGRRFNVYHDVGRIRLKT